jgi:hypothetical protein
MRLSRHSTLRNLFSAHAASAIDVIYGFFGRGNFQQTAFDRKAIVAKQHGAAMIS